MNRRGFLRGLATALSLPWALRLPKALPKPVPPPVVPLAGSFDKWVFPIIRNMPSTDSLKELASLQPMTGPASELLYLDFRAGGGMERRIPKTKAEGAKLGEVANRA